MKNLISFLDNMILSLDNLISLNHNNKKIKVLIFDFLNIYKIECLKPSIFIFYIFYIVTMMPINPLVLKNF